MLEATSSAVVLNAAKSSAEAEEALCSQPLSPALADAARGACVRWLVLGRQPKEWPETALGRRTEPQSGVVEQHDGAAAARLLDLTGAFSEKARRGAEGILVDAR